MSADRPGPLPAADRIAVRAEVARQRDRTVARLAALRRDFEDIVTASADAVRDDEHDPEGQTIAFERAQVAGLIADAEAQLAALDDAVARLAGPDAGRCERCGARIPVERLLVRPAALRCVACASAAGWPRA